MEGAMMAEAAAARASVEDAERLLEIAGFIRGTAGLAQRLAAGLGEDLAALMEQYQDRAFAVTYSKELEIIVDPVRARYSAWHEVFPRSASPESGGHGTFKDVEARLPYVAAMGFDVLYLPPIHPVGTAFRKGKNNALNAT